MATDIDMDIDIDMGLRDEIDPDIARMEAESRAINESAQAAADGDVMNDVQEAPEDGEVDSNAPQQTKIYLLGVDQFITNDIRAYAAEHYPTELFSRVEWINDNSANLVYDTDTAAIEALVALSEEEVSEPLQLRQAKRFSSRPQSELKARQAVVSDVKAPRAREASRFYLLNPEYDPAERKRRRGYDDQTRGDPKRRRNGDNNRVRRSSMEGGTEFDVDFYDDDTHTLARRRDSISSSSDHGRGKAASRQDLFPSRGTGRLRDRSASPARDGDGKYGFDEEQPARRTARRRSPISAPRGERDNRMARDSLRKELFPEKKSSSALVYGENTGSEQLGSNPSRELFPDKVNGASHRRHDARDLHPDEVADAIGQYHLDGTHEYYAYDRSGTEARSGEASNGRRREQSNGGKDLFSRITGGPSQQQGRRSGTNNGFQIKGAGRLTDESSDFSILGASRERTENPLVKELFPLKTGPKGAGNDLFDLKIKGRGAPRRRAEDMF